MNDGGTNFIQNAELREPAIRPKLQRTISLPGLRRKTIFDRLLRPLLLGVPIVLTIAYLGFNAADRYVATAEFVVQPPMQNQMSAASAAQAVPAAPLGMGAANPAGAMLSYPVVDYLQSGDALQALEKKVGFLNRMQGKTDDIFYRPEPWYITLGRYLRLRDRNDRSIPEADLLNYYNNMVNVDYSLTENIVTIEVQAFTAKDSQVIAGELLTLAEDFANDMTLRARASVVEFFVKESQQARERLKQSQDKLATWQHEHADFNPNQVNQLVAQVITSLEGQLATVRASLTQTNAVTKESPNRTYLEHQVKTLTAEIERETRRLSGMQVSMSPEFYEYSRLNDDVNDAERSYLSTLGVLQSARLQAAQQAAYVNKVYGPLLPDRATRPEWRFLLPITGLVMLLVYAILRIILNLVGKPWRKVGTWTE
jgi:capsular polysaccharide transport system permease protein